MTIDEIFSQIAQHMIKGIMTHEQLANYYDFLGLKGYKRMHEYHYIDETCTYHGLCRYFINHQNKLIPYASVDNPNIIPENWYKYTRQDVDMNTKKNAIKNGFVLWVSWERETKTLYEKMYKELLEIGEVAAAIKIEELVCDADKELKKAERETLELRAIDYDMPVIISEQEKIHNCYQKKTKKIGVDMC